MIASSLRYSWKPTRLSFTNAMQALEEFLAVVRLQAHRVIDQWNIPCCKQSLNAESDGALDVKKKEWSRSGPSRTNSCVLQGIRTEIVLPHRVTLNHVPFSPFTFDPSQKKRETAFAVQRIVVFWSVLLFCFGENFAPILNQFQFFQSFICVIKLNKFASESA